jgi:aryl-alcohol dehydrogenase (NADP+)
MQYVNLGKTGMKVSRLCLGMMSYGSREWRAWVLEEQNHSSSVHGGRHCFFDCRCLFDGQSEHYRQITEELGASGSVIVATKVTENER